MTEPLLRLFSSVLDGVRGAGERKDATRGKYEIELAKIMLAGLDNESPSEIFLEGINRYASQAESLNDEIMEWRADYYLKAFGSVGEVSASDIERVKTPHFDALKGFLEIGLAFALIACEEENHVRVDIEGDHLHNIPSYLTSDANRTLKYFKETEHPFYLDRIEQYFGKEDRLLAEQSYAPYWSSIMS